LFADAAFDLNCEFNQTVPAPASLFIASIRLFMHFVGVLTKNGGIIQMGLLKMEP
jgi:hypothetical protein